MALDTPQPAASKTTPATPTTLLSLPLGRLPLVVRLLLGVLSLAALGGVGYFAVSNYPDAAPPPPLEVEREAAVLFGYPVEGADGKLSGDLLIERFYALDAETGERYVADMLKGRIQGVQSLGPENAGPYLALLDLRNLQRDRALYAAFVDAVARPDTRYGNYLGLRAFSGATDAFRLNYDGFLPEERAPIQGPNGENPFEFLLAQKYDEVSKDVRLIRRHSHNYLLNSTDAFPFFRSEFRTGRALLLSEIIIVDTTGTNQRARMLQIQAQLATQTPRQP